MTRTLLARLRASPVLARLRDALPEGLRPASQGPTPAPDLHGPWPEALTQGLNLVGYARGGLGLGENLRRFAETLEAAGLPFALVDFTVNLGERGVDARLAPRIGSANPYPVNVFFINADQMPFAHRHFGPAFFAGRRNIGCWFWELEGFPAGDRRAALVVKTINGTHEPQALAALREATRDDPRIVVFDGFLEHEASVGLMMACDAFVSLHRSEGFGLGLAEAMYLGKPVIATGYSGNLDFMTPANSGLVRHRLVAVGPDDYLHGEGQRWAEPDTGHAAELMRRLVDEPRFARALGRAGAESIRRTHDRRACLDSMARALG